MPFLTREKYDAVVPQPWGSAVLDDTGAWDAALAYATSVIVQVSGITEPDLGSEDDAPAWVATAAAHIILWNRIGTIPTLSDPTRAWVESLHKEAMAMLKQYRAAPAGGTTGSTTGAIGGIPAW